MNVLIINIIDQLKSIQDGKNWIGSSFESRLNAIDQDLFFVRPFDDMHSVAEIISHLTLWRKETILKIETGKGSLTDDCEENWLSNDMLVRKGWEKIWHEYQGTLDELIKRLSSKEDVFLKEKYYDTDFKDFYEYSFVLNGMLHHDLYHLGQLGLILKYLGKK